MKKYKLVRQEFLFLTEYQFRFLLAVCNDSEWFHREHSKDIEEIRTQLREKVEFFDKIKELDREI